MLLQKGMDIELRLAGPVAEDDYGDALKQYIKQNNISDKVVLLGNLNKMEIMEELSQASLFALVSLEENSPMGIEEAMAAAVPVVTSNRCGMPYLVRHGECGYLVDPFDIDDIAKHIEKIISNNDLQKTMSEECKRVAEERFHPSVIVRRTLALYEEIIQ
jgi:glycosyltransferase involved in cell wall biosynthesis